MKKASAGLLILLSLGSLGAAQAYLEEVRACRFLQEGRTDEAIALLNRKLQRYPRNFDCHLYLGLAQYLKGDVEAAMETLSKTEFEIANMEKAPSAITSDRTFADMDQVAQRSGVYFTKERKGLLKFALGVLYKMKRDYKNAAKRFEEAQKAGYPEAAVRKQLLVCRCFLKDHQAAKEELEVLQASGEEMTPGLRFLEGYLAYHLKEEDRAAAAFTALASEMTTARRNLAAIHYNRGDYQKALEIWESILVESPEDVDALRNSGRAYYHLGQKDKGQAQFEKIGLKLKVEKYSPKRLPLFLEDAFPEVAFDFFCEVQQ